MVVVAYSHILLAQVPEAHQALVMQVAPVERGAWHFLTEQNPSAQSESPMHPTHMLLSQSDFLGLKVQSESARHCTHFSLLTSQTPSRPRALTLHSSDDVQVGLPRPS